jgi:hypothetical protein
MSTPEWVGYVVMAGSIAGVVAKMIYASSGPTDEERYCPMCKTMRPWHQTKGCSVCRTLDSVF